MNTPFAVPQRRSLEKPVGRLRKGRARCARTFGCACKSHNFSRVFAACKPRGGEFSCGTILAHPRRRRKSHAGLPTGSQRPSWEIYGRNRKRGQKIKEACSHPLCVPRSCHLKGAMETTFQWDKKPSFRHLFPSTPHPPLGYSASSPPIRSIPRRYTGGAP